MACCVWLTPNVRRLRRLSESSSGRNRGIFYACEKSREECEALRPGCRKATQHATATSHWQGVKSLIARRTTAKWHSSTSLPTPAMVKNTQCHPQWVRRSMSGRQLNKLGGSWEWLPQCFLAHTVTAPTLVSSLWTPKGGLHTQRTCPLPFRPHLHSLQHRVPQQVLGPVGRLLSITHISTSTLAPAGNALLGMPQSGKIRRANQKDRSKSSGFSAAKDPSNSEGVV